MNPSRPLQSQLHVHLDDSHFARPAQGSSRRSSEECAGLLLVHDSDQLQLNEQGGFQAASRQGLELDQPTDEEGTGGMLHLKQTGGDFLQGSGNQQSCRSVQDSWRLAPAEAAGAGEHSERWLSVQDPSFGHSRRPPSQKSIGINDADLALNIFADAPDNGQLSPEGDAVQPKVGTINDTAFHRDFLSREQCDGGAACQDIPYQSFVSLDVKSHPGFGEALELPRGQDVQRPDNSIQMQQHLSFDLHDQDFYRHQHQQGLVPLDDSAFSEEQLVLAPKNTDCGPSHRQEGKSREELTGHLRVMSNLDLQACQALQVRESEDNNQMQSSDSRSEDSNTHFVSHVSGTSNQDTPSTSLASGLAHTVGQFSLGLHLRHHQQQDPCSSGVNALEVLATSAFKLPSEYTLEEHPESNVTVTHSCRASQEGSQPVTLSGIQHPSLVGAKNVSHSPTNAGPHSLVDSALYPGWPRHSRLDSDIGCLPQVIKQEGPFPSLQRHGSEHIHAWPPGHGPCVDQRPLQPWQTSLHSLNSGFQLPAHVPPFAPAARAPYHTLQQLQVEAESPPSVSNVLPRLQKSNSVTCSTGSNEVWQQLSVKMPNPTAGSCVPLDIRDVIPIETARIRFLHLIVDHFVSSHTKPIEEDSRQKAISTSPSAKKRRKVDGAIKSEEGDVVCPSFEGVHHKKLPLIFLANAYETLIAEVNQRMLQVDAMKGKTMGLALEAARGLYRRLMEKFPKSGAETIFRRREMSSSSQEAKALFPDAVASGDDKQRIRFILVHGLELVERPMTLSLEDAEWFKKLTGRREVAIHPEDYKYFTARSKNRKKSPELHARAPPDTLNSYRRLGGQVLCPIPGSAPPVLAPTKQGVSSVCQAQSVGQLSCDQDKEDQLHEEEAKPVGKHGRTCGQEQEPVMSKHGRHEQQQQQEQQQQRGFLDSMFPHSDCKLPQEFRVSYKETEEEGGNRTHVLMPLPAPVQATPWQNHTLQSPLDLAAPLVSPSLHGQSKMLGLRHCPSPGSAQLGQLHGRSWGSPGPCSLAGPGSPGHRLALHPSQHALQFSPLRGQASPLPEPCPLQVDDVSPPAPLQEARPLEVKDVRMSTRDPLPMYNPNDSLDKPNNSLSTVKTPPRIQLRLPPEPADLGILPLQLSSPCHNLPSRSPGNAMSTAGARCPHPQSPGHAMSAAGGMCPHPRSPGHALPTAGGTCGHSRPSPLAPGLHQVKVSGSPMRGPSLPSMLCLAKFCDECGAAFVRETSKFCSECGTKRSGTS